MSLTINDLLPMCRTNLSMIAIRSPSVEDANTIKRIVDEVAKPLSFAAFRWALGEELMQVDTNEGGLHSSQAGFKPEGYTGTDQIVAMVDYITSLDKNCGHLYIFQDVHKFIYGASADEVVARKFKTLHETLKSHRKRVIFLGQNIQMPTDFSGMVHEIDIPLPDEQEIQEYLDVSCSRLKSRLAKAKEPIKLQVSLPPDDKEKVVRSMLGLTISEIGDVLRFAAGRDRKIDITTIDVINIFKFNKLEKLGVKFSPPPDVEIGGMDKLKEWLSIRVKLFSKKARARRLPFPKGILLLGTPGTGKSLAAKTTARLWGVPILSVDLGQFMGSLVGESEQNLREFFRLIEAIAPCCLFIDEIEKAFAGAASGPSTDSGVARRMFGSFLQWMQERKSPIFVVATANSLTGLPPEFLRKGRFDEIFFVDIPQYQERLDIINIHIAKYQSVDIPPEERVNIPLEYREAVAQETEGFSGAELGALIDEAAILAFYEDRAGQITLDDLQRIRKTIVPVAVREAENLASLREYCSKYARPASSESPNMVKIVGVHQSSNNTQHPGDAEMEF